jgi:hypothetical protein
MQTNRKRRIVNSGIPLLMLLLLAATWSTNVAQTTKDRIAIADGDGTLKVGAEEFRIYSVVVKLMEDGKAEINIVSDITVFVSGTWSGDDAVNRGIDLRITGGATPGGIEGTGKLFLRNDDKAVARLTMQGLSKQSKRKVEVKFEAQKG